MNELDHDREQLAALQTERAFLTENDKPLERVSAVDDQIDAVQDRIAAAQAAAGMETTDGTPPKARRGGRKPKPATTDGTPPGDLGADGS